MAKTNLTAARVRELLNYDPESGVLTWRVSFRTNVTGQPAGSLHKATGSRRIGLDGEKFQEHRIIWLHVHGAWPEVIDHRNGCKDDNRLSNLRSVDHLTNSQNVQRSPAGSKAPLLGAHWKPKPGKWQARIRWGGQSIYLGLFDTAEEAHAVYVTAKRIHHPGCTL